MENEAKSLAEIFAEFLTEARFEDIPEQAVTDAKYIIADSVAAIIGGMAEAEMQHLVHTMGCTEQGEASLFGSQQKTSRQQAAFLNGVAGTVLEMDEGHQFAKGHPAMHIFPALFSASETRQISGKAFLRAFILGYDVAARIGLASQLHPSTHPHGTWGGLGAAAAIASLNQLDTDQTAEYLNIASSLTLATSRKTMLEGGTVRNAYAGISNQMAHLGLTLLQSGFSGETDGIYSVFSSVISSGFDRQKACEALGTSFEVSRNYFKLHACCRYNHAALDALWQLMEACPELENLDIIEAIDVTSYNLAAELQDKTPRNVLACKFSVPFAIATTLYHGSSDVLSFTEQARSNPTIAALCQKVSIREDSAMTALLPELRPAKVMIRCAGGKVLSAEVKTNKGDWQAPYPPEALKQKYLSLATRLWPADYAEIVHHKLMTLEQQHIDTLLDIKG
jgi:2-methylcitrate dehydratase PrpD